MNGDEKCCQVTFTQLNCVPSRLIRLSGKEFSIFSMQIIDIILFYFLFV